MKKVTKVLGVGLISILLSNNYNLFLEKNRPETITKTSQIIQQIKDNQTIMFGEAHQEYTQDSEDVINILPELKKEGFEYLALETEIDPTKTELSDRVKKFMKQFKDGTLSGRTHIQITLSVLNKSELNALDEAYNKVMLDYINGKMTRENMNPFWKDVETVTGKGWFDLIDEAKKEGFKIIAYDPDETYFDSLNQRDKLAFQNLQNQIFDKDPDAKVIVYCGAAHLSEKEVPNSHLKKWEQINNCEITEDCYKTLGYHLNEYTKGKNLTINLSGIKDDIDSDYYMQRKK